MNGDGVTIGLQSKIKKYKEIVKSLIEKKELSEYQKDFLRREKII